tara:strand:- start:326 stop:1429 length:1104 start_codon:yes stop_codon:yes gene_type:complete
LKDGVIDEIGNSNFKNSENCDVIIDADGATITPGFIDSHVHITFGDYTPRQNTIGYLSSYLHGGTTTSITASEVHVPGRPNDPEGVKALAIAAKKCFDNYKPGGMTVYAGSVIIEPGLTPNDFLELKKKGVWLAKAGFGNVKSADEYIELVKNAKQAGLLTTLHTGGASIPGSFPITGNDLININPDVSFHINGGPVSIDDKYFKIISKDTDIFMQVCTAGNLRTAIICANEAYQNNVFERFLIATDTPTGSGIMPLGIIYTISQISSLSKISPELLIAAATGNVAKAYGLNSGFIKEGFMADLLIVDAPLGGTKSNALDALKNGDPFSIGSVITSGVPRFVGRSKNTPPSIRNIKIEKNNILKKFE